MISIHDKYSNPRQAAAKANLVNGLTPNQIDELHAKFEAFQPGLATRNASVNNRSAIGSLPDGASWDPRTAQLSGSGSGSNSLTTVQTPYQPEFSSPDRQQYPVHRILANRYWRLFYKLDPVIGNCIDMYSNLPWSNFELTGEGIEGEIRQKYEYMCRESQLLAMLPYFVSEYLAIGEAVPHCFYSNDEGVFTHIAMHNPDQLEVIDAPFIKMDPIIEFVPDERLRSVLTSNSPQLMGLRQKMPPELLSRLQSRQNIPLSPINATFIPRKLHPYDTRGTSILSRLWRVLMLEDSVFNATIQTARRHAGPIKVAKLGNAQTGWIPPPEQERRLLELLAQAEMDPNAWLVYHYGIQFDMIGTTDKIMSVNREYDIIERIKLVGLGISKSFLHGEVSYASSATGLQVFLQRLKALRMFFEQKWIYPKFFRPIAEINGWIKPKPAEVAHRFRVKRSARELAEQDAYIIPKIVWDKSLDPQISGDLIQAMSNLEQIGVKFSKTSKMAAVGYSFEEETKKIHREMEFEKKFLPQMQQADPAGGGGGGGMGGGGMPPPPGGPDGADGKPPEGGPPPPGGVPPTGAPPPPGGAPTPGAPPPKPGGAALEDKSKPEMAKTKDVQDYDVSEPEFSSIDVLKSKIWVDDKHGNWDAKEVADLMDLITTLDTESAFWSQLGDDKEFKKVLISHDVDAMWDHIESYLAEHDYPDSDILQLREILEAENVLRSPDKIKMLRGIEDALTDDMDDTKMARTISRAMDGNSSDDRFLIGAGSTSNNNLLGDISPLLNRGK